MSAGYKTVIAALDTHDINYTKDTNAGLFVYTDLSPFLPKDEIVGGEEGEFRLAQHFVNNGIFLHPGEEHNEKMGWFRLVFASLDAEVLAEGLKR